MEFLIHVINLGLYVLIWCHSFTFKLATRFQWKHMASPLENVLRLKEVNEGKVNKENEEEGREVPGYLDRPSTHS